MGVRCEWPKNLRYEGSHCFGICGGAVGYVDYPEDCLTVGVAWTSIISMNGDLRDDPSRQLQLIRTRQELEPRPMEMLTALAAFRWFVVDTLHSSSRSLACDNLHPFQK